MEKRTQLVDLLKSIGIVSHTDVRLTSGEESDVYFDVKLAYGEPRVLRLMGEMIASYLDASTSFIAASGVGGVPLAAVVSGYSDRPLTIVRDAARVHGLEKQLEGYIPGAHDVAAVIDDVLTTGGSIRYVRDALAAQGTRCGGVYVVVQRRDVDLGTPIHALTHADDFTGGHH